MEAGVGANENKDSGVKTLLVEFRLSRSQSAFFAHRHPTFI